ncbi:MAG: TetR/AcrR family transcriptional regulator [Polyangiaceae bacterium]
MARSANSKPVTPPSPEREQRGARRRRETHEKLLGAAFRLFAERGVDAVAINEITEAADVGFGSFYNHFPSKETLHDVLLTRVFEQFGDALDRMANGLEDPAEVLAASVRHALLRTQREPLWGKLLVRQSHRGDILARGLGPRLQRDLQRGIESGRFIAPDPVMTFLVVGSTILGAVTAQTLRAEAESARMAELGALLDDLDVRTAAALLRVLGLDPAESDTIARRPLPKVALSEEG